MNRKWFLIETAGLFAADQLLKTYAEQNLDQKRRNGNLQDRLCSEGCTIKECVWEFCQKSRQWYGIYLWLRQE